MKRALVWMALLCFGFGGPVMGQAQKKPDKGIEGIWLGTLNLGGKKLPIVITVARKPDNTLGGTLLTPDQSANTIPLDAITFKEGAIHAEVAGGLYDGKLNKDGNEIAGTWLQGSVSLPLKLKPLARPQEPKKPYPYTEEEVSYDNKAANVKLAGTLTLPKGKGPFPAVLLITGSGPQNRDEEMLGHKPFLVLSDYLTRRGVAVLRVDDRGVGGSTGDTSQSTTEDFVGDALTGVEYLKGRPEINPKQIGLVGHSEGGLIAPMAASRSQDIAFIVLMAGTGVPGADIVIHQGELIAKAQGATDAAIAQDRIIKMRCFAVLKEEKDNAVIEQKIKQIFTEELAKLPEDKRPDPGNLEALIKAQTASLMSPWFRYFLTCDPRPYLQKTVCPVLALSGEKDWQMPPKQNLPAITEALKAGGNKDTTVKELPGLNDLFQNCKTGSPSEYALIEETISPLALKIIGDWIATHTK